MKKERTDIIWNSFLELPEERGWYIVGMYEKRKKISGIEFDETKLVGVRQYRLNQKWYTDKGEEEKFRVVCWAEFPDFPDYFIT